jgi:phosphatidylserine decarboxylase
MIYELWVIGIGISLLLMILLTIKWKLPKPVSWIGAGVVSIVAALPFLRIYPVLEMNLGKTLGVIGQISITLALGCALLVIRFWRNPKRTPPDEDGIVLAPADGKVLYIKTINTGTTPIVSKKGRDYLLRELTGTDILVKNVYIIGIEMSFWDVHVNRCPIPGKVTLLKHIEGKFMSLRKDEAQFINARCTTYIENASLSVAVVQVASRLVRRVENILNLGESVIAGQRLGMIRFGSLVAIVLPQKDNVRIEVQLGNRVTAGVTVLARYDAEVMKFDRSFHAEG